MNILPVALAISLTRSDIWDINLVINRTLVYAGLTLVTMLIYILIVGYIGSLLQAQNRSLVAFLATGLVAVIFQPLREVLQKSVNRMMYGERDDPYAVLTRLSQRLATVVSPQKVLPTMVETIAIELRLPCVAVELIGKDQAVIAASYGLQPKNTKGHALRLPLRYQEEQIDHLILSYRERSENFTPAERQLLTDIASQVGTAAHAVKLTADLHRSRQQLITMREEERRRLRADLHDDLGPLLASMALKMDTANAYLNSKPQKTCTLLEELKNQTRSAIEDIRRIAYDLRPPALDELGLVGALREHFALQNERLMTNVSIVASGDISRLPAAVEVAAYRIAMEAVSNCLQHA